VREGELEALPFADATFDAVVAVNSIFYAADMAAAMRELASVVRPGGRVVVTAWGPPERCEALTALLAALGPLMPPPPPGLHRDTREHCPSRAHWRQPYLRRGCAWWSRARSPAPSCTPAPKRRGGRLLARVPTSSPSHTVGKQRPRRPGGSGPSSHSPRREHPVRERVPLGGGRAAVAASSLLLHERGHGAACLRGSLLRSHSSWSIQTMSRRGIPFSMSPSG